MKACAFISIEKLMFKLVIQQNTNTSNLQILVNIKFVVPFWISISEEFNSTAQMKNRL